MRAISACTSALDATSASHAAAIERGRPLLEIVAGAARTHAAAVQVQRVAQAGRRQPEVEIDGIRRCARPARRCETLGCGRQRGRVVVGRVQARVAGRPQDVDELQRLWRRTVRAAPVQRVPAARIGIGERRLLARGRPPVRERPALPARPARAASRWRCRRQ